MLAIAAKAGMLEPQIVSVADEASPEAGMVLCRTIHLGVCGTDREILESEDPWTPVGDDFLILGHECLAEVVEVGKGVDGLDVGDYVVPVVRRADDPRIGRPDLLSLGQYTERGIAFAHGFSTPYWTDRPEYLFKVPKFMRDYAVLTEPISISEKAINESIQIQQARLGHVAWDARPPRVLVTGQGPIGFGAVVAAVCRNWHVTMLGRDRDDSYRSSLASDLGAIYRRISTDCASILGPGEFDLETEGFDLVLECTGSEELMFRVAPLMRPCAVMVWLGSNRQPHLLEADVASFMRTSLLRNHLFLGSVNAADRDFADALRHLQDLCSDRVDLVRRLMTDFVSFEDSGWHYQHRKPQGIKTIVDFTLS